MSLQMFENWRVPEQYLIDTDAVGASPTRSVSPPKTARPLGQTPCKFESLRKAKCILKQKYIHNTNDSYALIYAAHYVHIHSRKNIVVQVLVYGLCIQHTLYT